MTIFGTIFAQWVRHQFDNTVILACHFDTAILAPARLATAVLTCHFGSLGMLVAQKRLIVGTPASSKIFFGYKSLWRFLWQALHRLTRLEVFSLRCGACLIGITWCTSTPGSVIPSSRQSWHSGFSSLNLSLSFLHL